mgnify:CR=1 FL=1
MGAAFTFTGITTALILSLSRPPIYPLSSTNELEKSAKSLQALNTIKDEIVQLQGLEKDLGLKINLKTKEISSAGETQANVVKKQHKGTMEIP